MLAIAEGVLGEFAKTYVTDGTMGGTGNAVQGIWYEREVPFDATLLRAGTNNLTLTVPAGPLSGGMIYDYLRLELDDLAKEASAA
jgi:hypothetical protein